MRGVRAMVASGLLVGLLLPRAAGAATCAPSTERTRHTLADVVFDGVATDGRLPDAALRGTAVTFSVRRWHKAPPDLPPLTLTVRLPEEQASTVRVGDIWRVYAREHAQGVPRGERCGGTRRLADLDEPVADGPGAELTGALAIATVGLGVRRRRRA